MSPLSHVDTNAPRRSNKRVKIMEDSGQTDADRRKLRNHLRELQKNIRKHAEEMENPNQDVFATIRSKSNALFDKVAYTREAVLDGENVELISSRAARQVDRLVQVPRYDAVRLTQKLVQKCNNKRGAFDWKTLGNEVGACFNAIPSRVTFLAGPLSLDYQPKERKKPVRRLPKQEEEDSASEEEPEEQVHRQARNANQLSAVERSMKVLTKTLNKKCHAALKEKKQLLEQQEFTSEEERKRAEKMLQKNGYDIDAIQYLFNPHSFTQTVENIFHFSFLIKKGQARIHMENEKPFVRAIKDSSKVVADKQAVIAFTLKDWKELCVAHNVTEGDLPNRSSENNKKKKRSRVVMEEDDDQE